MEPLTQFLSTTPGIITAIVVGLLVGNSVFGGAQIKAHIRERAADLATVLSQDGLVHIPKILKAFSVGDLAAAWQEIKSCAVTFMDPAQRKQEFAKVFEDILEAKLNDPTECAALQAMVTDAAAAFASGDPKAALPKLAQDAQTLISADPLAKYNATLPAKVKSDLASLLPSLPALAQQPGGMASVTSILQSFDALHLLPLFTQPAAAPQGTNASGAPSNGSPANSGGAGTDAGGASSAATSTTVTVPATHAVTVTPPGSTTPASTVPPATGA